MKKSRFPVMAAAAVLALGACQLLPPSMPDYPPAQNTVWLNQGWDQKIRDTYHAADQGTLTFGMPLEWFMALEQPSLSPFQMPPLAAKAYLDTFGFIPGDGDLPVGFAKGQVYREPRYGAVPLNAVTQQPWHGVGFTCAACHTGRLTYQGTEFLIDGGSALIDLGSFRTALGQSLLFTKINPLRWARFETKVLGPNASNEAKQTLRAQFEDVWNEGKHEHDLETKTAAGTVTEGFSRLDALNRIGNQVFAIDLKEDRNFAPLTAPVHFPHIWTAPWFTWVQYNGSIMQPMVRNAGEALGVKASVNLMDKQHPLFESTVQVDTLHWMEQRLAGEKPNETRGFTGLKSPAWPPGLPPIDEKLAAKGMGLYNEMCAGCHRPAVNTPAFWSGDWWTTIQGNKYLELKQIPIGVVGTDPEQARGMKARTVVLPADFPTQKHGFGEALGDVVELVAKAWYGTNHKTAAEQNEMNGGRPNRLQVLDSYKARPLNGIWAVPPYLHNGSVPSLHALLSPRVPGEKVSLGDREFDPVKVGYRQSFLKGGFVLDTGKPGNLNTGHEFRDGPHGNGTVGRALTEAERYALIEYLKTL